MSTDAANQPASATTALSATAASTPRLWNPNAAACWSLFFTPIFGAILHMKNWEAMGEPAKAAISKNWVIGGVVFLVILTVLPDIKIVELLSRAASLALLLTWYYSIGKRQNAAVLARYGQNYPRRGWAKPLLLAVLAMVGFVVVAGVIGYVIGLLTGDA